MKRYLMLILTILMVSLGLTIGCGMSEPDLPQKDKDTFGYIGFQAGYGWGYFAPDDVPVYWVTPDKYESFHRKLYIQKGYRTMEDFANAHFPDGTPLNDKQKKQAMDMYNWLFYAGFCKGVDDHLSGKPYSCQP